MKSPRPLAQWDKIRGGDSFDFYTIDGLDDEEYDDDEYEYYEVDEDDTPQPSSLSPRVPPESKSHQLTSRVKRTISIPNTISIRAIGTSMPNLSTLHHSIITNSQNLSVGLIKFLSVNAYASASIGAGLTTLLLVQIVLTKTKLFPRTQWGKRKTTKTKQMKKKKYGDYSKGYPEDNEAVVDLDRKTKSGATRRYWVKATNLLVPHSLVYWFQSASRSVNSMKGRAGMKVMGVGSFMRISGGRKIRRDVPLSPPDSGVKDAEKKASTQKSGTSHSSLKEVEKAEELQQQLDTLKESHQSLEQEYEASLRMLHEARLELRKLKSKESSNDNDESQKEQMEATIKNLESKYKQQMKEQLDNIRDQTATRIRAELNAEFEEKLQSQSQEFDERKKQYVEEFLSSPAFEQYVDEASAVKIEEAVTSAVEETIAQQQAKSREEMVRVREAIQKLLERERRMMKEQVTKATVQVRDWVKRQQLEQLQRREEQLRGEARKLGFLEDSPETIDVDEEDEDVAMAGDVIDRRVAGRRQSPKRNESGEKYTGGSLYDERRRGVNERRRNNAGRSTRSVEIEADYAGEGDY